MALGIDCRKFDFIDCPGPQSIDLALSQLTSLGAVISGKQTTELTELGRKMAKFPLDPKYSKILLTAPSFGCLEEVSYILPYINLSKCTTFLSALSETLGSM